MYEISYLVDLIKPEFDWRSTMIFLMISIGILMSRKLGMAVFAVVFASAAVGFNTLTYLGRLSVFEYVEEKYKADELIKVSGQVEKVTTYNKNWEFLLAGKRYLIDRDLTFCFSGKAVLKEGDQVSLTYVALPAKEFKSGIKQDRCILSLELKRGER